MNPAAPDVVLATTQEGIARSTDGGRTFGTDAAPVLAFTSWAGDDGLYGVDPGGTLNRSTDSGKSWKSVSTVPGGRPQALTAVTPQHLLVATQDGVYESKDGGKTFDKRLTVSST
ncbi:hypothetical protein J7E93_08460 [Streptomyces sp. ISL-36]|uniref:WD40/YVTN/BNR-like repeat-containing protein n=1 Tax=Streptomyces sp. ISL-36 TaxID=2819182 RepID=UPI001BE744E0|nr:hypothetical protein [Streptomyces sp. ISL-36]MBT2440147.1 hypothetical protein [Streptomyces sp. ISL-36]